MPTAVAYRVSAPSPDDIGGIDAVIAEGRGCAATAAMLAGSDISATRHAPAFVASALGGLVGRPEIHVSGGAGGPVALIVRRD